MVMLMGLVPGRPLAPGPPDTWKKGQECRVSGFLTRCVRGVCMVPSDDPLSQ